MALACLLCANAAHADTYVVDNPDAQVNAAWAVGTSAGGKYGVDYYYAATVVSAATYTAKYTPNIVTPGKYDIYVWYPAGSNRAANAPWTIVYDGGSVVVPVNQQINGGIWYPIATCKDFAAGTAGYVQLANNTGASGSVVIADAVQLVSSVAPAITTQPVSKTVCPGVTATFSVTATGSAPLSYQWRKNGVDITGATSSIYTIPAAAATDGAGYVVVISNPVGAVTSSSATLTVKQSAGITTQPVNAAVCPGGSATFSVVASGTAPFTYQWKLNGVNIAGATASSFTRTAVASPDAGNYSVAVGNSCGTVTSPTASLSLNSAPSLSGLPSTQITCPGTPVSLAVTAAGTAPFTYQWSASGVAISGATQSSYLAPATAGQYSVVVGNVCGSASASCALSVRPALTITVPPTDKEVHLGSSATFSVTAQGNGPLSYQWQFNGTDITGATTSTLTIDSASVGNAGSYTVRVNDICNSPVVATATLSLVRELLVDAGADAAVALPGSGVLLGSVTDVGAPEGTELYTSWYKVSGPGGVVIPYASNPHSPIYFGQPGTYVLGIYADDGEYSVSDEIEFTVSEAGCHQFMNGSFEWGMLGWSFTDGVGPFGPPSVSNVGMDGPTAVDIGGGNIANAVLSQTFCVVPGSAYHVSFEYGALGTPAESQGSQFTAAVSAGTTVLTSQQFTDNTPTSTFPMAPQYHWSASLDFTAPSDASEVTLSFTDISPNGGVAVDALIDKVVVEPVCEPFVNGSFEDGMRGWYFSDQGVSRLGPPNQPSLGIDGDYAVNIGVEDTHGVLKKTICVTPGVYNLSFKYASLNYATTIRVQVADQNGNIYVDNDYENDNPTTLDETPIDPSYVNNEWMSFEVPPGNDHITLIFSDTTLYRLANADPIIDAITFRQALTADAGPDQTITLPDGVMLTGSSSDPNATYYWSLLDGPGSVDIRNPGSASTMVYFGQPGTYTLQLTADNGMDTAWDEVVITVLPENGCHNFMNGSFENGMNGWTFTSGVGAFGPPYVSSVGMDGLYAVDLGGGNISDAVLSQTFCVTPGASYVVSFEHGALGNPANSEGSVFRADVRAEATVLATGEFADNPPTDSFPMEPQFHQTGSLSFTVPAGVGSVTLSFTDTTPGGGIAVDGLIDNVTVTPVQCDVPVVVTAPQSVSVCAGASLVFSVQATGQGPVTYQWSKNGGAISGATQTSLTIMSATSSDAGEYSVTVNNACGSVSATATLSVGDCTIGQLINVDVGAPGLTSPKSGKAATGIDNTDFWNMVGPENHFEGTFVLQNVLDVKQVVTPVEVDVDNIGSFGLIGDIQDAMFNSYRTSMGGDDVVITVKNLSAGSFDFYLYGHGQQDDFNTAFELSVNGTAVGQQSTSDQPGWNSGTWQEGVQYVRFGSVNIAAGDIVTVRVIATSSSQPWLNGLQIAKAGTPLPTPPLSGTCRPDRIVLNWTVPASIAGTITDFVLKKAETSGGPYTDIVLGSDKRQYIDSAVISGKMYYYVVAYHVAEALSPLSNEIAISTCSTPVTGAMDIAFIVDNTGSMGGSLDGIQQGINSILSDIVTASGNDYRLALVTPDTEMVNVRLNFTANNRSQFEQQLNDLGAGGGGGTPESTDECLNTVVNGLPDDIHGRLNEDECEGPPVLQVNPFAPAFRANVRKMVVLITDAVPGGFCDDFTLGTTDVRAHAIAAKAAQLGIKINAVSVGSAPATVMMDYAQTTCGWYAELGSDGSGMKDAILNMIYGPGMCEGPTDGPPIANPQIVRAVISTAKPITLTGSDPHNRPLTYTITAAPQHGLLAGTPPSVTYTPEAGYVGPDWFLFKVNNGIVDSTPATVSINVVPQNGAPIVNAGPDQTVELPGTAQLQGSATDDGLPVGSSLSYTWTYSGPGAVTFDDPHSPTAIATITVTGTYTLTLTVSDGDLSSSDDVMITVAACRAPTIVLSPQGQNVCQGTSINLGVQATGTAPLSYQWNLNGNAISGAVDSTYTVGSATVADSGSYTVTVTSPCGTVTSSAATVAVTDCSATQLIDVDFGAPGTVSPKVGKAAVGKSDSDFWNMAAPAEGFDSIFVLSNLKTVEGLATSVELQADRLYSSGTIGSADLMFNTYRESAAAEDITLTLANLEAGTYDLLLYGHGPEDFASTTFSVIVDGTLVDFATTGRNPGWNTTVWTEGVQYVRIANVTVEAGQTITIDCWHSGENPFEGGPRVNGLQVVRNGCTPPTIAVAPTDRAVCSGESTTFTVQATAATGYQWQFNGGAIAGATQSTYTIPAVTLNDVGTYTVSVMNGCGTTTASAYLQVLTAPTITQQPQSQAGCIGGSVTLNVQADTGVAYHWFKDGVTIAGATTSQLTISPLANSDAGDYSVTVDNSCGSTSSDTAVLTVGACKNVLVYGPTAGGLADTTPGINITVWDEATWESKTTADFAAFDAIVFGDQPPCAENLTTWNTAIRTRNVWSPAVIGNAVILGTDTDEHGKTELVHQAVTFAANGNGTGLYFAFGCYYWQALSPTPVEVLRGIGLFTTLAMQNSSCPGDAHKVANHPVLNSIDDQYLSGWSCSAHEGFHTWPADFKPLAIIRDVDPATYTPDYVAGDGERGLVYILARGVSTIGLDLTTQPACVGNTASVTAHLSAPDGSPIAGVAVAFEVQAGSANAGAAGVCSPTGCITDANGNVTWSYSAFAAGLDKVYAFADSNGNGIKDTDEPNATTALMSIGAAVILEQPAPVDICADSGAQAVFRVRVAPAIGPVTYQWRKNNVNLADVNQKILGANSAALVILNPDTTDVGDYEVVIGNPCGTTVSTVAALSISTGAPTITVSPQNQSVCVGGTATFSVEATGDHLSYQWSKDGVVLVDGQNISGSTTASLTVSSVDATSSGSYQVIVKNGCGDAAAAATLIVRSGAPVINGALTLQPSIPQSGQTFSLSVNATDADSYQWWKDGVLISTDPSGHITGEAGATLTINNFSSADFGEYYAVAINGCGQAQSATVSIQNLAPAITTQPQSQTACVGSSVTFSVVAEPTPLTYQWYKDGAQIAGATDSSYTIPVVDSISAGGYSVRVANGLEEAVSADAVLTIPQLVLQTQPQSQTVCAGGPVTFSVTAGPGSLTYQWAKDGANIAGATGSSYAIIAAASADQGTYTATVSGLCGSLTSDPASLQISPCDGVAVNIFPLVDATEPNVPGAFAIVRNGATESPLTVAFTIDGTAVPGTDYSVINSSITIPAGSTFVIVTVSPIDNAVPLDDKSVQLTLAAGAGYAIGPFGTAAINIVDNDGQTPLLIKLPETRVQLTQDHNAQLLSWSATPGVIYQIESADLFDLGPYGLKWIVRESDCVAKGATAEWLDVGDARSIPRVQHPFFQSPRVYRVQKVKEATGASPTITIQLSQPGPVQGIVNLTGSVSFSDANQYLVSIGIFVDGQKVREVFDPNFTVSMNTTEWPNGTHQIYAVATAMNIGDYGETTLDEGQESTVESTLAVGVSQSQSVVFDNFISEFFVSSPFFRNNETQQILAHLEGNSNWRVTIVDYQDTPVRQFTGQGSSVYSEWDGKDDGGNVMPYGYYDYIIEANSTQAVAAFRGPLSAQAASSGSASEETRTPTRIPGVLIRGFAGTVGIGYQGHHPSKPPTFQLPPGGGVLASAPPWGKLNTISKLANNFSSGMAAGGWQTSFLLGDDKFTPSDLVASGPFSKSTFASRCNFGFVTGHMTSSKNTDPTYGSQVPYYPFFNTKQPNHYTWVGMPSMSLGSSSQSSPLMWMAFYGCQSLKEKDFSDMWSKFLLPMPGNMRLILGSEDGIFITPAFGARFAANLNGMNGEPMTIFEAWCEAARDTDRAYSNMGWYKLNPYGVGTRRMSVVYRSVTQEGSWNTLNDSLWNWGTDISYDWTDVSFIEQQVWP